MRRFILPAVLLLFVVSCTQVCMSARKIRGSGNVVTEDRQVKGITGVELATIGTLYIELGKKEKLTFEAEDNILPYLETRVRGGVLKIDKQEEVDLKPRKPVKYYLTVKELDEIVISSAGNVEAPDLKADKFSIISSSAGDLEMGDLDVNSLEIMMRSAGDVDIGDVEAKRVEVTISSAGDLTMRDLDVNSLKVRMSSAGNAKIRNLLAKTLRLRNSSAGTMVIKGGKVEEQDISLSSAGSYMATDLESAEATISLSSIGDATINVRDYLNVTITSAGSVYFVGNPTVRSRITSVGRVEKVGN